MPIQSALRDRKSNRAGRKQPAPPILIQPQEPGQGLAASINAVSGLMHYIHEILAGPMRGSPEFFKQYLRTSYKSAADLLKQLTARLDGIPALDSLTQDQNQGVSDATQGVISAATQLLAIAAEHDSEAAGELALALEHMAYKSGFRMDEATKAMLEASIGIRVSMHAEARLHNGDLWVSIEGRGELIGRNSRADIEIQAMVPAENLNIIVTGVRGA